MGWRSPPRARSSTACDIAWEASQSIPRDDGLRRPERSAEPHHLTGPSPWEVENSAHRCPLFIGSPDR
jgi:hypothetical protein